MSFSSTPLGQGRRLDHHTFLNKNNPNRPPNSPPRRAIPASYAYGAPSLASRSPPKPERVPLPPQEDDSEEPALVRFARLKQREQATHPSQAQSSRSVGLSVTSPHPEKWSVKDTSVNIASAFHQAATSSFDTTADSSMNPNEAWASGIRKPTVPRSTSVEYEKETQSTVNRRLAPPPSRSQAAARVARPVSKTASIHHVPDSEGEEEPRPNGRGKTPIQQGLEIGRGIYNFFLRERSQEPEGESLLNGNESTRDMSSYDYSAEEREYQAASQKPPSRKTVAAHRKNRISMDNKAYRPSMSDLEESDEEFEEDGKRTRRKKTKKTGPVGGPLTSLPVTSYDKRRRRKRGGRENGAGEEDEGEMSEEEDQISEERFGRGTTPVQRAGSLARGSVPPPPRQASLPPQYDSSNLDNSMDIEGQLHSITEVDEEPPLIDGAIPRGPKASFSVGATLGRLVHGILSAVFWVLRSLWALVAGIIGAIARINFAPLMKTAIVGLTLWAAWYALNSGMLNLGSLPTLRSPSRPYQPPDIPAGDLSALSARLQNLERVLASLSLDVERSRVYIEGDSKHHAELVGRVGALESRVQKESIRAQDAESKFRATTSDNLNAVKNEIAKLYAQIQAQREAEAKRPTTANDEEVRAKVKALEERVGTVEGGVKEALELGKGAAKAGAVSGNVAQWWNKLATGKTSGVTIKSTDGQDVTSLINHLVDAAVLRNSKDTLARVDYALHSAGAHVIPSLTSITAEIRPSGMFGQIAGLFTGGSGYAVGRPPVTALHHEIHTGHCWPFPGSQGQLGVALAAPVYITDVTIDHVAKEVAMDMRSAPRNMELWGLVEGQDNIAKYREWKSARSAAREEAEARGEPIPPSLVDDEVYPRSLPRHPEYVRVANFTYDIHSPDHIQTFAVRDDIKELGIDFGVVVLLVKSNWGKEFTCLYRLRVHGEPVGEVPLPYPEDEEESA
ncbi:hypothetical protein PYCCODRAFT_1431414 [Trametes coccinea BRFM310]|uniref:SUN domain-containing protein n=1 Tax=Trametes coccinea (strain BRFM310) TaxID=1353009 RepID=A0A1Y2IZ19_TRAC3|nr:hypothetical protein PYCCODRAFT_1431414 [Trametes coccinea BRFM310]